MTDNSSPSPIIEERRPGIVTFVAVLLFIQAAMAIFGGVFGYVQRNDPATQEALGLEGDQFLWFMVIELAVALFLLVVAGGILSGARWARLLVTIGAGFRLVQAAVFATLGGYGGTGFVTAILYAVIPLIVLWAVWGSDKGEAWFHQLSTR